MANREWLNAQSALFAVDVHVWGRSGEEALRDLESALGVRLNEQVASFVSTIGNAHIGSFEVIIAGSPDGAISALTETRQIAQRQPIPSDMLMVMDNGSGTSHFLNVQSGEVIAFDSLHIAPGQELRRYGTFDEFLTRLFERAQAAMRSTMK